MANQTPEYQRRQTIQPAASPTGFNGASSGLSEAFESFGALSSQIASNAAQESARIRGQEAGKTPGNAPGFAITSVDKTYKEAYIEESTKVLGTNADRLMDKLSLEFSKIPNPTGNDLVKFQEEATQGLSAIVDLGAPEVKRDLSRSVFQRFDADSMRLALSVEKADRERILANFNNATDANLVNIFNYSKRGMNDAVEDSYQTQLRNLDSVRSLIGEDKFVQGMLAAKMSKDSALAEAGLDKAYEEQGELAAIEYLKKFATSNHSGITESERDAIVPQLYNRYVKSSSIKNMDDTIHYSNAEVERQNSPNQILPVDRMQFYQENLSPTRFNELQIQNIKAQRAASEDSALAAAMVKDFGSSQAMLNYSGKQKDQVFKALMKYDKEQTDILGQPYDNPILRAAQLAQNIKAPVTVFLDSLAIAAKFGDTAEFEQAGQAIKAMQVNNPIGLQGLDKDARAAAQLFNHYRLNTQYSGEEAAEKARNDVYGIDEDTKISRGNRYRDILKDKGLTDEDSFTKFVANNVGATGWFSNSAYPSGLINKVRELLPSYFERSGNWDIATNDLFDDLKNIYKETTINNRSEIMVMPPESVLPNAPNWISNDKAAAFKELVNSVQQSKVSGGYVLQDLEWNNAPDFKDMFTKNLVSGDLKASVNGVERKIIIVSDDVTQLSTTKTPSWAFMYLDDNGIPQPIMDSKEMGGIARWYPDLEGLAQQQAKYPGQQLELATSAYKKNKQDILNGVKNIGPSLINSGELPSE